jgi:hypothetical protein
MSGSTEGLGWLPVDARDRLAEELDAASRAEADRLLALPPRERVLVLMERAALRSADDATHKLLRPADLLRVLEGFPGEAVAASSDLSDRYPGLVLPPET